MLEVVGGNGVNRGRGSKRKEEPVNVGDRGRL